MKHRKELITKKVEEGEDAVIDFNKFKKKEIKKIDEEFKAEHGDSFDKSPTPSVAASCDKSTDNEEEEKNKNKELTDEEKATIGAYFKKRIEEHMEKTR